MLILAGVSLNAIVGDNGILTQAQNAKVVSEKSNIMEQIETELLKYNIDTITGEESSSAATAISDLIKRGIVDNTMASDGSFTTDSAKFATVPVMNEDGSWTGKFKYVVGKKQYVFNVYQNEDDTFTAEESDITGDDSAGGEINGGTTLVTEDTFKKNDGEATDNSEKGKYTINGDAKVIFVDSLEGEYSIYVKSGATATVSIFKDMTLTNAGIKRSAIDIEPGGTLNLWIAEGASVTVNSGLGEDAVGNIAGKGGYAGIHVPENAILNLKGNGIINAIGGNAGKGGTIEVGTLNDAGSGGGGAGAGIGGNGGEGGKYQVGIGADGKNGENAGNINIYNSLTVKAYGGAGGSGGKGSYTTESAGGAGGYPGAGIGGGGAGGAGGTCCAGAGGYTGGSGDMDESESHNGLSGGKGKNNSETLLGGGGYFEGGEGIDRNGLNRRELAFGGMYNQGYWDRLRDHSGNGGIAGNGGNIIVSQDVKLYAYNGNLYTDGTDYKDGLNQTPIYAQAGIITAKYTYNPDYGTSSSYMLFELVLSSNETSVSTSGYKNTRYDNATSAERYVTKNSVLTNVDMSKQGIGSGAGYIEISNGTYTVDSSLN